MDGSLHCWYELNDSGAFPGYCAQHRELTEQVDALLAADTAESCTQACALWQKNIEELYDDLIAATQGERSESFTQAKQQWKTMAGSHHAALEALWSADTKKVETRMENWLRSQAISLCALEASIGL